MIAKERQARLNQSIVLDNRPGAGTTLGAKAAAAAEPDGYTLLYISNGHVFGLYSDPGYDTVKSFAPVCGLTLGAPDREQRDLGARAERRHRDARDRERDRHGELGDHGPPPRASSAAEASASLGVLPNSRSSRRVM